MDIEKFKSVYDESRNGANEFYRHPLARRLIYSDGVRDLAETGCYWLLDIIGTETVDFMRRDRDKYRAQITVSVNHDGSALIGLSYVDGENAWTKGITWADLPAGDWVFFIANDDGEGHVYSLILPTEY